jgi:hypothetical protein
MFPSVYAKVNVMENRIVAACDIDVSKFKKCGHLTYRIDVIDKAWGNDAG